MQTFNTIYRGIERDQEKNESASVGLATFGGIAWKTVVLLMLTIISGVLVSYFGIKQGGGEIPASGDVPARIKFEPWLYGVLGAGGIVSFIAIIIGSLFPKSAVVMGPLYAISKGAFLGTIATIIHVFLPVVGFIALGATLAIFLITLLFNMIAPFRAKSALFKIFSVMTVSLLIMTVVFVVLKLTLGSFFVAGYGLSAETVLIIGIAMSVFFIIYGAIMLNNQFSYGEVIVATGADKIYEWSVSFGILFSLIVIYLEVIRLLLLIIALKRE